MMKNIRKALLGIVVIGGLMFVGCDKQEVPNDVTIDGAVEDDLQKYEEEEYDDYYIEEPEYNTIIGDAPESPEDLDSYEAPEGCCAKCGEKLGPDDVNMCAKCTEYEMQYCRKGYGLNVNIHWERDWYGNDFANFINAKLSNNDSYQYNNVVIRYTVHFTNGLATDYETNLGSVGANGCVNISTLPGALTRESISTIDNITIVSWN